MEGGGSREEVRGWKDRRVSVQPAIDGNVIGTATLHQRVMMRRNRRHNDDHNRRHHQHNYYYHQKYNRHHRHQCAFCSRYDALRHPHYMLNVTRHASRITRHKLLAAFTCASFAWTTSLLLHLSRSARMLHFKRMSEKGREKEERGGWVVGRFDEGGGGGGEMLHRPARVCCSCRGVQGQWLK